MKPLVIVCALLALAIAMRSQTVPAGTVAKETYEALNRIDEAFDQNLKGWTRERYIPFQPSSGLAEKWQTNGRYVRLFISKVSTATAEFYSDKYPGERLDGIGDAAKMMGYNGDVSFRHGDFGVSISSAVHLDLWSKEANGIDQAEAKATSRLIACFVNLALDGKLTKDWPHRYKPIFERQCERELLFKGLIGDEIMKQYTDNRR